MPPDRLVAVTQRVVEIPEYGEIRDCLDQEWTAWLSSCGFTPIPVPNRLEDVAGYLARLGVVGVVLTGGNNLALDVYDEEGSIGDAYEMRDQTELAILEHCSRNEIPVVGFCRGMQVLQAYGGGELSRLPDGPTGHVATTHEISLLSPEWQLMAGSRTLEVNSFHDYGFRAGQIPSDWEILAIREEDGVVEAIAHRHLPFFGVAWHPERPNQAAEFDRRLLEWGFSNRGSEQPNGLTAN